MTVARHPEMRVQRLSIGREGAPLLVVDNLVADPDELVDLAASKVFSPAPSFYPGVRAKAPLTYQRFILEALRPDIDAAFGLAGRTLRFTECNFSLTRQAQARNALMDNRPVRGLRSGTKPGAIVPECNVVRRYMSRRLKTPSCAAICS